MQINLSENTLDQLEAEVLKTNEAARLKQKKNELMKTQKYRQAQRDKGVKVKSEGSEDEVSQNTEEMAKELGERMEESESYSISASGKSSIPKSQVSMSMVEEPVQVIASPSAHREALYTPVIYEGAGLLD